MILTNLSYIIYLDANDLYEHSMIQPLPTEILDWASPEKLNLEIYLDDDRICSFLKADLNHVDKLHDLYNDQPLAAEIIDIIKEIMFKYQSKII